MGLLDFIGDKLKVLHKSGSMPTAKSREGFHFVWTGKRAAIVVVSKGNIYNLWDTDNYKTKTEVNEELGQKANSSTVEAHSQKIDVLSVTKAEKSVVDALQIGMRRQPAVDTYNDTSDGKTSLLSKYKNPENGWDVLVKNDETKGGKSNRYNWNGSMWVDMETGVYDENVATKQDLNQNPSTASGKYNDADSFFVVPDNKICIKKTGLRVLSMTYGMVYYINMTKVVDGKTIEGTDKLFEYNKNKTDKIQFLVINTPVFKDNKAWIDDVGLFSVIGESEKSDNHIILASWYAGSIDEHIGVTGNTIIHSDYNEKVSVVPYLNNKFAFYFNNAVNTPTLEEGECSLTISSFILLYRGVSYKIIFDSAKTLTNTFGTEGSENSFLTSFNMNLSRILLDMSAQKDYEGYRYLNVTDENFADYFFASNSLSNTYQLADKSSIYLRNDSVLLISMYKREPVSGLLLPYYSRYNTVNFRDRQYYVMSEWYTRQDVGLKLVGDVFTFKHLMFYETDFSTRQTSYYQVESTESIEINLKEGDTVVLDTDLLKKNTESTISLDNGEDAPEGVIPALKLVKYGEYKNTQLPIVQKRIARVYEHPAFSPILLRGQMELMGKMFLVFAFKNGLKYHDNTLTFNDAFFIYTESPYKLKTNYMRIDTDVSNISLNDGETIVIDTSKIKWNDDTGINKLSEVTKKVNYGNYLSTDIPIAHYRREGMNFYPLFAAHVATQNEQDSNLYSINKTEFLPAYFSVKETKVNANQWVDRVNLLHISDIHIGSEDADINLQEAVRIAKEKNVNLSALIATGDLSVGFQGASSKVNCLSQMKACSDIVLSSPIPALTQLGNHDANDADRVKATATTKKEQWDNTFAPIADKWTNIVWGDKENNRHYHYYDIAHGLGNIRVIMLDQLDHDLPTDATGKLIYSCQEDVVYSQKQIDWLCNVALRVPAGSGIIICNHFGFMERGNVDTSLLIDGQFVQGWQLIPDIVNAWQNKTTLIRDYSDIRSNTQPISVNANFSTIGTDTEFICYLAGHTHFRTYQTVRGYKQLLILEDSSGQRGNAFSKLVRTKKSPTSNTFSILSIDRGEKRIYRTSYGAYKNYDEVKGERIEVIDYRIL